MIDGLLGVNQQGRTVGVEYRGGQKNRSRGWGSAVLLVDPAHAHLTFHGQRGEQPGERAAGGRQPGTLPVGFLQSTQLGENGDAVGDLTPIGWVDEGERLDVAEVERRRRAVVRG